MIVTARAIGEVLLCAVISLVLIVLFHQSEFSFQRLLIGRREFSASGMVMMTFAVGFISSFVVLIICRLVLGRLPIAYAATSIAVQIAWIESEWNFTISAKNFLEIAIRFAEQLGTVFAVVAAALLFRLIRARPRILSD